MGRRLVALGGPVAVRGTDPGVRAAITTAFARLRSAIVTAAHEEAAASSHEEAAASPHEE